MIRASGTQIIATPRGYVWERSNAGSERKIAVLHAPQQMREELYTIVDQGAEVVDVIVEHPTYGPVSYTHLDVYKRQVLANLSTGQIDLAITGLAYTCLLYTSKQRSIVASIGFGHRSKRVIHTGSSAAPTPLSM